jgi:TonB family protein
MVNWLPQEAVKGSGWRMVAFAIASVFSLEAMARDAAHPDTRRKLNEALEAFYQAKPLVRGRLYLDASLPQPTCEVPRYPTAARRYDLEGATLLSFQVDSNGRAVNAEIDRGSGSALLDEAALASLSLCIFNEPSTAWSKKMYQFALQ